MPRIRHCVECVKCSTRYLVASTPYANGSYLMPTRKGCSDEYILYCSCGGLSGSPWKWNELIPCDILQSAYERGYGTADEIFKLDPPRRAAS